MTSALDQMKAAIDSISSDPFGFNEAVTFTARTGEIETIYCIPNKIGRKLETNTGMIINTKNPTVVFSEANMPASYPVRNSDGEVSMIGDRITMADSTGTQKQYIVQQNIPDENPAIGLITLILGDYEI